MTTDTLRTALEALVSEAWMSDEDGSCVLCGYGFAPDDHTLTDCPLNLARAALATQPATEERCGWCDGSGRIMGGQPCLDCHGSGYYSTPPATEERCENCLHAAHGGMCQYEHDGWTCACSFTPPAPEPSEHEPWCHRRHEGHCVDGPSLATPPAPEPSAARRLREAVERRDASAAIAALDALPAPEPSAALVEARDRFTFELVEAYQSESIGVFIWGDMPGRMHVLLDAIVAAARAEGLDGAWAEVERVLPKGAWVNIFPPAFADPSWMAGVVLPNGPFPVSRGANPVEALRNLAAALADRTTEAG